MTATDDTAAAPASHARPVVAVVAWPGTTAAVRPLVAALARRVDVRTADRAPEADAVLVTDRRALDRAPGGRPTAVVDGAALQVGDDHVSLPCTPVVATATLPPLAPHVRRRWRQRLGLDPDLVVDTVALAPDDVPTALAVVAAALVGLRDLPTALALGCPVVTDASSAAAVGAADGDHVVVGERGDAVALALDDRRAARLSRRGRDLAGQRLDPDMAVRRLLRLWDLEPRGSGLATALDDLGTAAGAPIRRRAAAALTFSRPSGGT